MATARTLHRQLRRRVAAALLVVATTCIALPAIAPAPVAAAAPTLATTSATAATDAVGQAAATLGASAPATTPPPPPPAAGDDDAFFSTFRDLCLNRSSANDISKCLPAIAAACKAFNAKIDAGLGDATSGSIDLISVARDALASGDPASQARATACAVATVDSSGGRRNCHRVDLRKKVALPDKLRSRLVAQAPKRLVRMCGQILYEIPACRFTELRADKCLGLFRQGKSTFETSRDFKETVSVSVLRDPKSYTETVTRTVPVHVDCCSLSDRCLCQLKKKLGNNTTIPCLAKKELQACN